MSNINRSLGILKVSLIFLVSFSCSNIYAQEIKQEIKIGLIDPMVLFQESAYGKGLYSKMEKEFKPRQSTLEGKERQLKTKQEALQRDKDVLSVTDREKQEKDLTKMYQEAYAMNEELNADIADRQEKFNQQFKVALSSVLEDLAKAEKLDLIINSNVALFNTGKSDYTYKALKLMDTKFAETKN